MPVLSHLSFWLVAVSAFTSASKQLGLEGLGGFPLLSLPYGKYQATTYEADLDVYTFKNIRFAAPPVGGLRFAAPADPPASSSTTVEDGTQGSICLQALRGKSLNNSEGFDTGSEDCLCVLEHNEFFGTKLTADL